MKKATNSIGYITAFAIVVTSVFKFEHFPGAGAMLCLTGLILSVYFPVFIIDRMNEKNEGKTSNASVTAAISSSLISLGIVFRLWHWPGANILFTLGFVCFSLVFIPMLFMQRSKEAGADTILNLSGASGLACFGLGILFKLMHWPGAAMLLALCPAFLFLVYFPKYMMNSTISIEVKHNYLRNSFFVIVIGTLVALYFIKSIEIHDMEVKVSVNEKVTI